MKLKYKIRFWIIELRRKIGGFIARMGLRIVCRGDRFDSVKNTKGMIALKCLEPDQTFYSPGVPYTWVSFGQCPYTEECMNHKCFFKRRDCHGHSPWAAVWENLGYMNNEKRMTEKYGEVEFPEFDMGIGTNCIRICCKSAKGYIDCFDQLVL